MRSRISAPCSSWTGSLRSRARKEKNADDMLKKYDLYGSDPKGLYSLNSELAARVYTAPSLTL